MKQGVQADVSTAIGRAQLGFCINLSVERKERSNTLLSPRHTLQEVLDVCPGHFFT